MKYIKALHIRYKIIDGRKIPVIFESRYISTIDIPYSNYILVEN